MKIDQKIILASASPRRKELLADMGLKFTVQALSVDECSLEKEPFAQVKDIVQKKSKAAIEWIHLSEAKDATCIICADTVVVNGAHVLGKPQSKVDAFDMLEQLSGQRHRVLTAFTIDCSNGKSHMEVVETEVEFMSLSRGMIDTYLQSNEYKDKAGAYAIQGKAGQFVKAIYGSFSNVVGLPQVEVFLALKKLKIVSV